jgi:hypothetical protein
MAYIRKGFARKQVSVLGGIRAISKEMTSSSDSGRAV